MYRREFPLIDLDAAMANRAEAERHRERLNEETSFGKMRQSDLQGNELAETGRNDQSRL